MQLAWLPECCSQRAYVSALGVLTRTGGVMVLLMAGAAVLPPVCPSPLRKHPLLLLLLLPGKLGAGVYGLGFAVGPTVPLEHPLPKHMPGKP